MKTKIITDSLSDITKDVADIYDIEVLQVRISLGDGVYKPSDKVNVAETVKWIEQNKKLPDFKGIDSNQYEDVFKKYIDKGMEIVCITGSASLISNYDCACHASTRLPNNNIQVIDSKRVTAAIAAIVIKAAEMAQQGESANAIVIQLERLMNKFTQFGLADSVKFMQYAGVCPRAVALGSNVINAKFKFNVHDNFAFDVEILGYNMDKAVQSYCKQVFKGLRNIDPKRVVLTYTLSDENYYSQIYQYINSLNYFEDIVVCKSGNFVTSVINKNAFTIAYELK